MPSLGRRRRCECHGLSVEWWLEEEVVVEEEVEEVVMVVVTVGCCCLSGAAPPLLLLLPRQMRPRRRSALGFSTCQGAARAWRHGRGSQYLVLVA